MSETKFTLLRNPSPGALVIAFPVARQVGRIRKVSTTMARSAPKWAELQLREQRRRLEDRLRRVGVPEDAVQAESRQFETAVRAALWRLVLLSPGSGGGSAA